MGRTSIILPSSCMTRSPARVRVRLPSLQLKPSSNSIRTGQKTEFLGNGRAKDFNGDGENLVFGNGNRVMVVVDSSIDAKGALQWALSHTVQSQDTIILLCVTKPSKQDADCNRELNQRAYELLYSMKTMCQMRRPGVQVEVAMVEGREKGPVIVEEAKQQRASLLVLGRRKRSMIWRLRRLWAGSRIHDGVVEHCIQNASCMTIAVRRKSRKLGGYLITTKRHKNFWLLA